MKCCKPKLFQKTKSIASLSKLIVRLFLDDQAFMALDPKHSRHDIYNFVLPRSSLLLDIDLLISLAVVQGCFFINLGDESSLFS
jgi:hypothetical protein